MLTFRSYQAIVSKFNGNKTFCQAKGFGVIPHLSQNQNSLFYHGGSIYLGKYLSLENILHKTIWIVRLIHSQVCGI